MRCEWADQRVFKAPMGYNRDVHLLATTSGTRPLAVALGDLPTWIGAIGTLLGVVAASVAAWFVYGQLRELRDQSRLQREAAEKQEAELAGVRAVQARQLELVDLEIAERRSAQARQVKVARQVHAWGLDLNIENGFTLVLVIDNTSHGAIRDVTARYAVPGADDEPGAYAYRTQIGTSINATPEWLRTARTAMPVPVVDPEKSLFLTAHPRAEEAARQLGGILRFTDVDDRHWQVSQHGALSELAERDW